MWAMIQITFREQEKDSKTSKDCVSEFVRIFWLSYPASESQMYK